MTSRWVVRKALLLWGLNLRKKIDLEDPTPLIDQVFLRCTQRAATNNEETIRTKTEMFQRTTTSNVKAALMKEPTGNTQKV